MDLYSLGLRSQDVNAGLRTFDAASSRLSPLKNTRIVGMAADLAALVRDRSLIDDVGHLEMVAAEELDIPPTSFDSVLQLLEDAELVSLTRVGSRVTGLTSEVPMYSNLYARLGHAWRERQPTQLEEELVAVVHRLAAGPVARESLEKVTGIDRADRSVLLSLGHDTDLIKEVHGADGPILYSPYTAFEDPALLVQLSHDFGTSQMADEFEALRQRQGLAVGPQNHPFLYEAVGRGLLLAPAVELPGGGIQPFAALPYTLDKELLSGGKPILDKALAILACVRCGQEFGGFSALPNPLAAVNKLLREGELAPHSSSARQYGLLVRKGILQFAKDPMPWGKWVVPTLIDTPDNRRALQIAYDLLALGESMSGRQAENAQDLLSFDNRYVTPMKSASRTRKRLNAPNPEMERALAGVFGYGVTS